MVIIGIDSIRNYKEIIKGRVWVFPDNVDTDVISPGKYLDNLHATLEHTCETIYKQFPKNVKDGDIIVAGRNFGCGSSRETAPAILQEKGIAAIIAESFARIFYRSSIARALPLLEIEGTPLSSNHCLYSLICAFFRDFLCKYTYFAFGVACIAFSNIALSMFPSSI